MVVDESHSPVNVSMPAALNHEKANFRLKDHTSGKVTDEFEPLYRLAISAKRYVLGKRPNRDHEGRQGIFAPDFRTL
jgi:hypothetical protein